MSKWGVRALQILFGAFYLANGVNFFLQFYAIPRPHNPIAGVLMEGFVGSGLFTYVKVIEVVTGLSMLTGLFVPLVLIVSFPVTVMIGYVDVIILGREMQSWFWGGSLFVAHSALLVLYLPYYRPMLVMRARHDLQSADASARPASATISRR